MEAEDLAGRIAAIDKEYTTLCTQLGDITVRKEQVLTDEANVKNRITQLRIDRAALNLRIISEPASPFAPMTEVANG